MHQSIELSICICTCRRPEMLERLLAALLHQSLQNAEVIVVDNDPAHSAHDMLVAWCTRLPLRFVHLPIPNISAARNKTVELAEGEWIAFIDDDELPVDNWVSTLLEAQRKYAADIVMAPVIPTYPEYVAPWLRAGAFFERRRFQTGQGITDKDARTGNALVRTALLKARQSPFDTDFGQSGGEDTILFRRLYRSGAVFIWCDEAGVTEEVAAERASAAWLLRRAYRVGQTSVLVELYLRSFREKLLTGAYLALRALSQLLISLLLVLAFLPFSPTRAFRWLRTAIAQLGKLSALSGARYLEYAR